MRNEIIVFLLFLCVYLFLKYQKSILEKDTLTKIQSKILVSGFGTPILLFAVLFAVLWLTDHKLGWFSYMTRDGWTFFALVVTYFVFASAFMHEKDKARKAPFYWKMMVFIMILVVVLSFTTDGIKNPFGDKSETKVAQPTAQVAPPQISRMRTETITAGSDHFAYKDIPDDKKWSYVCPRGTLRDFTYNGIPEEEKGFFDCDVKRSLPHLGDGKTGRRIGFMLKGDAQTSPTVTIYD